MDIQGWSLGFRLKRVPLYTCCGLGDVRNLKCIECGTVHTSVLMFRVSPQRSSWTYMCRLSTNGTFRRNFNALSQSLGQRLISG